jgi:hypothetical protein
VCTLAVKKNQGRFRHVGSDHSLVSLTPLTITKKKKSGRILELCKVLTSGAAASDVCPLLDVSIPVSGRGCPQGCETSRLPHFLDSRLTDSGNDVNLKLRLPFLPGRFLVLISVRD